MLRACVGEARGVPLRAELVRVPLADAIAASIAPSRAAWAHHRLVLRRHMRAEHGMCAEHGEQNERHEHARAAHLDGGPGRRRRPRLPAGRVGASSAAARTSGSGMSADRWSSAHMRAHETRAATVLVQHSARLMGAPRIGACGSAPLGRSAAACDLGHAACRGRERSRQPAAERRQCGSGAPANRIYVTTVVRAACSGHWGSYVYASARAGRALAARGSR
jgi:hypothetical protein